MSPDWYVHINEKEFGPYSAATLKQYVAQGRITPTTQVRNGKEGHWIAAQQVKGLFISPASPTPIPLAKPAPPRGPSQLHCSRCGVMIQASTAEQTSGLCRHCATEPPPAATDSLSATEPFAFLTDASPRGDPSHTSDTYRQIQARIRGMSFEEAARYCEAISADVDDELSQSEVDQIRRTVLRKNKVEQAKNLRILLWTVLGVCAAVLVVIGIVVSQGRAHPTSEAYRNGHQEGARWAVVGDMSAHRQRQSRKRIDAEDARATLRDLDTTGSLSGVVIPSPYNDGYDDFVKGFVDGYNGN